MELKLKIIFLVIIVILSGCLGNYGVKKQIWMKKGTLSYIHSNPIISEKSNIKIFGEFENRANIPKIPVVKEYQFFFLPLIFVYYGSTSQEIILGQSNYNEDFFDFFKKSYYDEAKISGDFIPVDLKEKSDYFFKIFLDSTLTYTYFKESATVGIGGFMKEKNIQPGTTYLELRIEFYRTRDNELIFDNEIELLRRAEFIYLKVESDDKLFQHTVKNMTESLSYSIRDFISYLVRKSNLVVEKYHKNKRKL